MIGIIAVGTAVRDVFAKRTAQARAPPAVEIVLLSYILRVPLRAIYRAITKSNRAIYRTITGIIFTKSDHKNRKYMGFTITKWTNGQNLGRYITKITKTGNIEDLRGSQWVNIGHNNDINWSDQ